MGAVVMTYRLAWAASTDAGNRHMEERMRHTDVPREKWRWNLSDRNHAAEVFNRLYPMPETAPPTVTGLAQTTAPEGA